MKKLLLTAAVATCLSVGCSNPPKSTTPVPAIPTEKIAQEEVTPTNVSVAVRPLHDGRTVMNPKSQYKIVNPEGNVGNAVEKAITSSLTEKGMIVTRDAPVMVNGEILKWSSEVKPGSLKAVESNAEIYVELIDVSGKRLFKGTFSGQQELKEVSISEKDVQKSLGLAMEEAVSHVVSDRNFLDALWTSARNEYSGRIARSPEQLR